MQTKVDPGVAKRTIVVLDLAHSGTTMVAGILHILGVPMVRRPEHLIRMEDREIIGMCREERAMRKLISVRNRSSEVWGYKHPGAWKFAPMPMRMLTNPIYIAIYKDIVTVTRRRFNSNSLRCLANTAEQIFESLRGLAGSGLEPLHVLSYTEAVVSKREFVCKLSEIAGISPAQRLIDAAVGYIQPNEQNTNANYPRIEEWL